MGRLDLGHVGMFGHSLGGAAAASSMLVDPRIDAGADLDGVLFGAARSHRLSRPVSTYIAIGYTSLARWEFAGCFQIGQGLADDRRSRTR